MAVVLDTGILYAYYDRDDRWHPPSRQLLETERGGLVVPAPVIPEVDHLLGHRLGTAAQEEFYRGLVAGYFVADLPREGYDRVLDLNRRYRDLGLGFVDAAVLAIAERLGLGRIATADRRHFGAVRIDIPLELVPEML